MIICNEHENIELTDQSLHKLNIENTICYVFVGGNPGGTEGDIYVFVIEDNEMKIYVGNIYYGDITKEKIIEIYSKASDWVEIPYVMGHYVYVRKKMAEDLQNNWKSVNAHIHFERLVKGVLLTAQKYESEFTNNQSLINSYVDDKENVLCKVFGLYPKVWQEPNRFKALLMDFLPQDKLKRNLLCICLEEKIPDELFIRKTVNNIEISIYKKKLINACGCSDSIASEVLSLWMNAFNVTIEKSAYSSFDNISLEELGLSVRSYNCLKRIGIKTVRELIDLKGEDFVRIRNLGTKSAKEVIDKLKSKGVPKEKIEDFEKALNDIREERQREREEREKREKIKEMEEEVTDLSNQLQQLQIQVQLKLAAKKLEEGDFPGSVSALENAVELGYKGNYSFLGTAYLTGINGVQTDFSKGFNYLNKFYEEFKDGVLDIDDKGCMVQVCHNLATCYLWELQEGNSSESLRQYKLNNVLDLYKEAVDFAPEEKDEENSSTSAEMLMVIGCCFYYGEIHSEGHDDVTIPKDYEYAYKAFTEAERLGNVQAISLLAEMYEEGKYVEKDSVTAERKYLRAAIKSEKNAIEWCQKHYIDDLPWDKYQNWESILLSDVLPERMAESAKVQGELITLEDIHQFEFKNLKGRNAFKAIQIPRILDLVGKFVVEYNPAIDEQRQPVFEPVMGQVKPRLNDKKICSDTSIDELDLTVREYNALKRAGINTIGDLKKLNSEDMMGNYDRIRRKLLDKVIEKIKKNNELIEKLKELGIYLDASNDNDAEHNHPGRDKCDKLREIRKKIAEANGIDFIPAECHHTGPCLGTCPVCDEEIKYIDNELQKKRARGEEIVLNGIAANDIKESGCDIEPDHYEDIIEMGMALPPDLKGNKHNGKTNDSDDEITMGMVNPDDFSDGDIW